MERANTVLVVFDLLEVCILLYEAVEMANLLLTFSESVCWHTFTRFKVLAFLGVTWVSLGAIVNVHTTALSCLFVCLFVCFWKLR